MDLMSIVLLMSGFVLVVSGAELFVRGSVRLAMGLGVSPLVIGLTVVAYGTSSPELAVSVYSGMTGSADLALGNVAGSNICNVLLILGLSALVAPLTVSRQLIRWDVPLMIGVSTALILMSADGRVGRLDGAVLILGSVLYTLRSVLHGRKDSGGSIESLTPTGERTTPLSTWTRWGSPGVIAAIGLVLLLAGSHCVVRGAVSLAQQFGVSELIIGLTIVAIGTSLPELATSMLASFRNQRDIAVGNVVGSNIFNILLILGAAAMLSPSGIAVSDGALRFDLPVVLAVAVACLPVFLTGGVISRREGAFFVLCYLAYVLHLIAGSSGRSPGSYLHIAVIVIVCVLVVVTVVSVSVQVRRLSWPRAGGKETQGPGSHGQD